MGMHAVRVMFETWAFALAMNEVAHLASLKEYYLRFLSFLTVRYDQDSGLRPPTVLEAQSADKAIMTIVHDLMLERGWSADDSLHELTYMRAELASLLQPRPRLTSRSSPSGKSSNWSFNPSPNSGKGKSSSSSSKGKPQKGKGQGTPSRPQWITEMTVDGEKKQLCMRFQSGKCSLGSNCKFYHGCAYPVGGGLPCGKPHGAMTHAATPH